MKLFLVGGFLGSGKTTAIYHAVTSLHGEGKKTGVITNDQGEQQVDTNFFRSNSIPVEEVSGSCFCCNLPALNKNIQSLQHASRPDIIFAESVGSCTDLLATVVNPLINAYGTRLDIVLSVLADIQVLMLWLQGNDGFHENVKYIYGKQLEEAEILVINKIDTITGEQLNLAKQAIEQAFGSKTILYQNSLDNGNIANWIDTTFTRFQNPTLRSSLEIDYDKYGAGEAEMAWLDEEVGILTRDNNAAGVAVLFIEKIRKKINEHGYPVGHLKFLLNDGHRQQKISYTSVMQKGIEQPLRRTKTNRAVILINARVQTEPAVLSGIIADTINELEISAGCKITESKLSFFKPGYPKPSERIAN